MHIFVHQQINPSMKKILILFVITTALFACKKEDQEKGFDLNGSRWELSWFPEGSNVIWYDRLDFISSTEVVYYRSFTTNKLMSAQGKATLTYTVENPDSDAPKIHVKGKLNSAAGGEGKGESVDYVLTYMPSVNGEFPKLAIDNQRAYTKVVYN